MIRRSIVGIPLESKRARRWFVAGYWLTVTIALLPDIEAGVFRSFLEAQCEPS